MSISSTPTPPTTAPTPPRRLSRRTWPAAPNLNALLWRRTAVAYQFADAGDAVPAAACVFVVLGSLMVSYTRARAEALGVECKVGIATRPVRVVILSIGLVFGAGDLISDVDLLPASIYAMAALTAFTVGQRVWHVRGELRSAEASSPRRRPAARCNQPALAGTRSSTRSSLRTRQEDLLV